MKTYQHKDGARYAKYRGLYIAWLHMTSFDRWACGVVWKVGDSLSPHPLYFGDTVPFASEETAIETAKRLVDRALGEG